ncbi:hypothetical protein [Micromonospora sp. CPCC 205556]|uniref:hypothetical protein n=1 Tax=Micromonospora sp. CPCC 205556 TaxID=3122398 RepID=UPI002FF33C3B
MTNLNAWWESLPEGDRDLFIEHVDTAPLPAEVVERFTDSGQLIAGTRWVESDDGYTFHWPSWVREFLVEKTKQSA